MRGTAQRLGVSRVLCDASFPLDRVRELLAVEVAIGAPPWSGEDVVGLLSFEPVGAEDLARLPALRVIATPSVGFDHIDVPAATARGVWVCNVPDYCVEEVADHTLGLLLAAVRKIPLGDRLVHAGEWGIAGVVPVHRLRGRTLGLVGFGHIGVQVGRRAASFGLEVIAFDPYVPAERMDAEGVGRAETLDDLLPACDVISIHVPLVPATRGLIDADAIARMRHDAVLINTSRGPIVDEPSLLDALRRRAIAGAALDVFETEPLPIDAPVRALDNVILLPHLGYVSKENWRLMYGDGLEDVEGFLEGKPVRALNMPLPRAG